MTCSFLTWLLNGFKCPQPAPPAVRPLAVTVRDVSGIRVRLESPQGQFISVTDVEGRAGFPTIPEAMTAANIFLEHPDYKFYGQVIQLPPGGHDIIIGPWPTPLPPSVIQLPAFEKNLTNGTESGPIHVDGTHFRDAGNNLWQWRGFTEFLAFYKYLLGQDINSLLSERIAVGVNVLRVLGMVSWDNLTPRFHVSNFPDYYQKLEAFIDLCAARGIRVEFVVFADAQIGMPNQTDQQNHINKVMQILGNKWNVFIECCNEPFKNGVDVSAVVPPKVGIVLRSSGDDDITTMRKNRLDYLTVHDHIRKDEWPRSFKDALELQGGFGVPGQPDSDSNFYPGSDCPVIWDEPMGADEIMKPGARSNVPTDFEQGHGVSALWMSGSTFHSTCGVNSESFSAFPITEQSARAAFSAMKTIGKDTQVGQYTRGGLGNCPIEHSDDLALRTFVSIIGGEAWVVVVRPQPGWVAKPVNGWRIVETHGLQNEILRLQA